MLSMTIAMAINIFYLNKVRIKPNGDSDAESSSEIKIGDYVRNPNVTRGCVLRLKEIHEDKGLVVLSVGASYLTVQLEKFNQYKKCSPTNTPKGSDSLETRIKTVK